MKTQKSRLSRITRTLLVWLPLLPLTAHPQSEDAALVEAAPTNQRPARSDTASRQLIDNYLAVTGGRPAHLKLYNVVAEGTIKESSLQRTFKLVETTDGKRHLTYQWTHLGRPNRVVFVHDGLVTWTQVLEPKRGEAKVYGGADGTHFAHHSWLIQPFTLPELADYVFKYQGTARVSGRPAHMVQGWGKKDVPSWFYFDQEKYLLIRWGGEGQIAGVKESMDYRATAFKSVGGVLMPSSIDLLAEDAAFGHIAFDRIQVNQDLNDLSFFMPQSMVPTLRQRPVAP